MTPAESKRNADIASSLAVLAAVAVFLAAILSLNPFQWIRMGIIRCFAGTPKAKVERLWKDPRTQEVTNGEHPKDNLDALSAYWASTHGARRIVLMGNSQTFSMILAPAEPIGAAEERTYPDFVFASLNQSSQPAHGYRLSAPNISYMEALWYLHYLLVKPGLKPDRLVLQLNYETFRKAGVREGMLELLDDGAFAAAARAEAAGSAGFAAAFQDALQRYEKRKAGTDSAASPAQTSKTGIAEAFGYGARVESSTRAAAEGIPLWGARHDLKATFLDTLYLLRVHILRITPTTKRSIGGAALEANRGALERIGQVCRENGIELVLFDAPQNPVAQLFRTDADRALYRKTTQDLAERYAVAFYDFENSVPEEYWGKWVEGPDPIHFGRAGHRLMANLMLQRGVFQ